MTEEIEILIDGVNVAGCNYFREYLGMACREDLNCSDINNCYYKQLKRLEQENAQLKNERTADLVKQLKRLQAENEQLKENYRLSCLKCEYKNTKADVNKYRKALEEIREIAGVRFVSGINEEADAYNQDMSKIYNKINEVLK